MATNYARASYTEVYDVQTAPGSPTIIGVHTPDIGLPYKMLGGFFRQFSKFKYAGCDISFIPVSTLPLDPLQVGFEAGQSPPQDLVNPILHRGFMGESMGQFFDTYFPQFSDLHNADTPGSVDWSNYEDAAAGAFFENAYYQLLSDSHFLKSGVQQGFIRNGLVPLVRRVNTDMQFGPYVARDSFPNGPADASIQAGDVLIPGLNELYHVHDVINDNGAGGAESTFVPNPPTFFSSGAYPLDWLDCDTKVGNNDSVPALSQGYAWLPRLYMYFIMLPPSAGTVMYFRMVIKHRFEFKDFRCLTPLSSDINDAEPISTIRPFEPEVP